MADARDAGSPGGTATQFLPASTSDAEATSLASTTGFPNAIASMVLLGIDPIAIGSALRRPTHTSARVRNAFSRAYGCGPGAMSRSAIPDAAARRVNKSEKH